MIQPPEKAENSALKRISTGIEIFDELLGGAMIAISSPQFTGLLELARQTFASYHPWLFQKPEKGDLH